MHFAHRLPYLVLTLLIAITLGSGATANANTRIALVIGNSDYRAAPLANPANDAREVAEALDDTGFAVTRVIDANRQEMRQAIRDFTKQVKAAGRNAAAVFYFAGHGIQADGRNYLIPIAAELESVADLEYEAVDAQWALDLLGETRAGVSIVILDACRNNPFRSASRSGARGLAQMDAPRGSILAYSTAPGAVAADGQGQNSPYSGALSRAIRTPGVSVEEMFKQVRRSVLVETEQKQIPWESSSLVGDFYFGGAPSNAPTQAAEPPKLTAHLTPGVPFMDCPDCPEMMPLRGAEIVMGAPTTEAGSIDDERPETSLSVPSFGIGVTEVTRGQFKRFVDATGHKMAGGCWHWALAWLWDTGRSWTNPGFAQDDDHPVLCVRWQDAVAYAAWLSDTTGQRYRLPSEAEWEFAARADNGGVPWSRLQDACVFANIYDRTAVESYGSWAETVDCADGADATAPVKRYSPNGYGLYDMIGNAQEWTADCWNKTHHGRPRGGSPRLDGDCSNRVWKGGHFASDAKSLRPPARIAGIAVHPNAYGGFRVARDL